MIAEKEKTMICIGSQIRPKSDSLTAVLTRVCISISFVSSFNCTAAFFPKPQLMPPFFDDDSSGCVVSTVFTDAVSVFVSVSNALTDVLMTNDVVVARIAGMRNMIQTAAAEVINERFTKCRERLNASTTRVFSSSMTGGTRIQTVYAAYSPIAPKITAPMTAMIATTSPERAKR